MVGIKKQKNILHKVKNDVSKTLHSVYNNGNMNLIMRYLKVNNKDLIKFIQKDKIFENINKDVFYLLYKIISKYYDVKDFKYKEYIPFLYTIDINVYIDDVICMGDLELLKICNELKSKNFTYTYKDNSLNHTNDCIKIFKPLLPRNVDVCDSFLINLKDNEIVPYFNFVKTHFIHKLDDEIMNIELNDLLIINERFDIISTLLENDFYSIKGIEKLFEIITLFFIYFDDIEPMYDFLDVLSKHHKNFFNFVYNNSYIDNILAWCIYRISNSSFTFYIDIIDYLLDNFDSKPLWTFKDSGINIEKIFINMNEFNFLLLLKLGMCPSDNEDISWFNFETIKNWNFSTKLLEDLGKVPINRFTIYVSKVINKFLRQKSE